MTLLYKRVFPDKGSFGLKTSGPEFEKGWDTVR